MPRQQLDGRLRSGPSPIHTASRDEDLEVERGPAASSNRSGSDAREQQHAATEQAAVLRSTSPGQELGILSSSSLPNLSCSPRDASCVSISTIADPRKDPSLSRQVREYMSQLVASGMRAERAAHIIQQWSGGGGVERVDLARLRRHFMTATLLPTLQQRLPSALSDVALTSACFWSLGLLPTADQSLLHPALRGALVAVNLLLLVHFASCSLRTTGRVVRIGNAAVSFSQQAELVLLALQALSKGHGAVIAAAQGTPLAAVLAADESDVDLDSVMAASDAAIAHAKAAAFGGGSSAAAPPAPPSAAATAAVAASPPPSALSSLDSFLVLSAAAAGSADATGAGGRPTSASGRFDAVTELGLSAEEAAAAAVAYSRYGDSSRGGRIGDYELRRLLQEAGFPSLSPTELSLVLLLHDPDKKSWLSFRDWATWWAGAAAAVATPATAAKDGRQ